MIKVMNTIILATSNKGKINELHLLLDPIKCIPQSELHIESVVEDKLSFLENALAKARHASFKGCMPALADDSGLVVPALNGQPGIVSARYAGNLASDQDNMALLLKNMSHLTGEQRRAFFYCALAVVRQADDPAPLIATGMWAGQIAEEAHGLNGFGYDPIFYIKEYQCSAAEMSATIKNNLSHRAQALNHLRDQLQQTL